MKPVSSTTGLLLALLLAAAPAGAAVPGAERTALTALYNATGGSKWTKRTGWLGRAGTECSWHGVTCNGAGTSVIALFLSENGLKGSLPAGISGLTGLQSLEAEGNALSGSLPKELGRLTNLRQLRLGLNQITGPLPRELSGLSRLETLALSFNRLSGPLPPELGRLTSLSVLDLSHNQWSGSLPAQLGDLRRLEHLDLASNRLTGPCPPELGRLAALRTLDLSDNQLSGSVPEKLGDLASLEALVLADNLLSDRIPPELGRLTDLMFLDLSRNQLSGTVPSELGDATALLGLVLSGNRLAGNVPGSFLNLTGLEILWLDHNRFAGPVPFELGALSTLLDNGGLDLRSNSLATDTEPGLLADLNAKQAGGDWISSQTLTAPFEVGSALGSLTDRRTGGFVYWTFEAGAQAPPLQISTSSGTGDVDLYIRFGAPPTVAVHDFASATAASNQESVSIQAPRQGTYYVGLHAKSPYRNVLLRIALPSEGCFPGATALCLGNGRFKIQVSWRTRAGTSGAGQAVPLTADTGYFWFFQDSNVEMILKVLDACPVNGKFWVYAGGLTDVQADITVTDTVTRRSKTYHNPLGTPFQPIQDSSAFEACDGGSGFAPAGAVEGAIKETAGTCATGPTSLCLSGGRFRVEVTWKTPDGQTGAGKAVPLTADTGYFSFFSESNVEMVLKVLNACPLNGKFWVYAGGLTNVETTILVTDTMTGATKTYLNPQGTAFRPIQDTSAFGTCP